VLLTVVVDAVDPGLTPALPQIAGFTPAASRVEGGRAFALYRIDTAGTQVLSVNAAGGTAGRYSVRFLVAGDANADGRVDGTDAGLLEAAFGTQAGDSAYRAGADFDADGRIDATDTALLFASLGYAPNQAPVLTQAVLKTHEDLELRASLGSIVTDPEGDAVSLRILGATGGTATIGGDGRTLVFQPEVGFTGTASVTFEADDGFSRSASSVSTITVSDAPLVRINIVGRNPALALGERRAMTFTGDFADERGVALPASYLQFLTSAPDVATVSADGTLRAVGTGNGVLTVRSHGIEAVTAFIAGEPRTLEERLLQTLGVDIDPDAVTVASDGGTRQLRVFLPDGTNVTEVSTGTRYFISNPDVITISDAGLVTGLVAGEAEVTVLHGGAEKVFRVKVDAPIDGPAVIGADGGIVRGNDGSTVAVAPGALAGDATVGITRLADTEAPYGAPDGFDVAAVFRLDVSTGKMGVPAQLKIPVAADLAPGTEVVFFRAIRIPQPDGTLREVWLQEEIGVVGDDGFARTRSDPYPGVQTTGTYMMGVAETGVQMTQGRIKGQATFALGINDGGRAFATLSSIGGGAAIGAAFGLTNGFVFTVPIGLRSFEIDLIPTEGLPVKSFIDVELKPGVINQVTTQLPVPANAAGGPSGDPVVREVQLKLDGAFGPELIIRGERLIYDYADAPDIPAANKMGFKSEQVQIVFDLPGDETETVFAQAGGSATEIRVTVPSTVTLGLSSFRVIRPTTLRGDGDWAEYVDKASQPGYVGNQPQFIAAAIATNQIALIDRITNTLAARVPVGAGMDYASARSVVISPDGTRAYVAMRNRNAIAVVDLVGLREIDTRKDDVFEPGTIGMTQIELPTGANAFVVTMDKSGRYLYATDERQGLVYVVNTDPLSPDYNRFVTTVTIAAGSNVPGSQGLRGADVSADGKRLYIAAPGKTLYGANNAVMPDEGDIVILDVDPNSPTFLQKTWKVQGVGVEPYAVNATIARDIVTFSLRGGGTSTGRTGDAQGFSYLTANAAGTSWTRGSVGLNLGTANDSFDLDDASGIVVTRNLEYAFVTGYSRYMQNNPSRDPDLNPLDPGGGKVGVIRDPFNLQGKQKLLGATRSLPLSFPEGIALSTDDKFLYVGYGTLGGVFVYDAQALIAAAENPPAYIDPQREGIGNGPEKPNPNGLPYTSLPLIDVRAAYGMTQQNNNGSVFGITDPTRAPIGTGGIPRSIEAQPTLSTAPVPRLQGTDSQWWVDDDGSFTLLVANDAVGTNPNAVMRAKVTIEGSPNQFLEASLGPGATGPFAVQSSYNWVLGAQQSRRVTFQAKDLLTDALLDAATENRLYGAKFKLELFQGASGGTAFQTETFYVHRLWDISDDDHKDGKISFVKTLADGTGDVLNTLPLEYRGPASARPQVSAATIPGEFQWNIPDPAKPNEIELVFDPVSAPAPGTVREAEGEIVLTLPGLGGALGSVKFAGDALPKQRVYLPFVEFRNSIASVVDRTPRQAGLDMFLTMLPPDSDNDNRFSDEAGFDAAVQALYDRTVELMTGGNFAPVDVEQAIEILPDAPAGEGIPFQFFDTVINSAISFDVAGQTTGGTSGVFDTQGADLVRIMGIAVVNNTGNVRFDIEMSNDGTSWATSTLSFAPFNQPNSVGRAGLIENFTPPARYLRLRAVHADAQPLNYAVQLEALRFGAPWKIEIEAAGVTAWNDFHREAFVEGGDWLDEPSQPITGGLAVDYISKYSILEERYRFAEMINRSYSDFNPELGAKGIAIRMDSLLLSTNFLIMGQALAPSIGSDYREEFANRLANLFSHELGHALGTFHVSAPGEEYYGSSLMGEGHEAFYTTTWDATRTGVLKLGLGLVPAIDLDGSNPQEYEYSFEAYVQAVPIQNYSRKGYNNAPAPSTIDERDLPRTSTPVVLGAREGGGFQVLLGGGTFGTVTADAAAPASIVVHVGNVGSQPITIDRISLESGSPGLSVVSPASGGFTLDAATVAGAPDPFALPLTWHPRTSGTLRDAVLLHGADLPGGVLRIPITGRAVAATGELTVAIANNNLGGQDVTGGALQGDVPLTITNTGSQPLRILSFSVVEGAGVFGVGGELQGASPRSPVVIGAGETLVAPVFFNPEGTGLQRGVFRLLTDDPTAPEKFITVVGTGVSDAPLPDRAVDDFVLVDPLRSGSDVRLRSDASGTWTVAGTETDRFNVSYFDPVSGLVAQDLDFTLPELPDRVPAFQASTANDTDGDGLPDDIETILGTSLTSRDTNRDGVDDFLAVARGIDPGRARAGGATTVAGSENASGAAGSARLAAASISGTTATVEAPAPAAANAAPFNAVEETAAQDTTTAARAAGQPSSFTAASAFAVSAAPAELRNGQFSIGDPSDAGFGWSLRGQAQVTNGRGVLAEDVALQSGLTQTFAVPEGALSLSFDLIDADFDAPGDGPQDAFEVALLDAVTGLPVAGIANLTSTDALLNIQADGSIFKSAAVALSGLTGTTLPSDVTAPVTVTIDLSGAAAPSGMRLHFDLLGFGALGSRVVVDNVRFNGPGGGVTNQPPVAAGESFVTTRDTPIEIDVAALLENDSDPEGRPLSFVLADTVEHGTLTDGGNGRLVYTPEAGYTGADRFTYRVSDGEATSGVVTVSLDVRAVNAAPTLTFTDRAVVEEGGVVAFTVTGEDADGDDLTYSLLDAAGDLGTALGLPTGATIDADTGAFRWQSVDGDVTHVFRIAVSDGLATTTREMAIRVENVAPTLTATGTATVGSNQPYTLQLSVSDPGDDTLQMWMIDWGDGSNLQAVAGTARELSHVFQQPGQSHVIQVSAIDEDGIWAAQPVEVTVVNPRLYVTQWSGTESGVELRFSRAFDAAVLNVYDTALDPQGPADIVLRNAAGEAVRGSLLLHADRQGASFVTTGGPLAAGRYTISLTSGAQAFKDSEGIGLDGNVDTVGGDDFTGTFLITGNSRPTIGFADVVIGPRQTADVPVGVSGIPVTLTTQAAATEIAFSLRYDPALLTVAGLEGGRDLPSGSRFTISGTPGDLRITVSAGTPVEAGVRELVRVLASVPDAAPYRESQVLDIHAVRVDGADARGDDAVQIVAYLGDTTGDARYTNLDGQRVNRIAAGLDSGLGAYKRLDPVLLGDVNRDGTLTSADGTIITRESQFVVGGNVQFDRPEIAPIPSAQQTPALGTNAVPVTAPIPPAPVITPEPPAGSGETPTATGGIKSAQWMAQAVLELNRMRLPSLPSQDLSMQFLNGQRTWENVVNRPVSASDSWRITLPPMPADTPLPDGVPEDTPGGTLAALRYLVRKKLGILKS